MNEKEINDLREHIVKRCEEKDMIFIEGTLSDILCKMEVAEKLNSNFAIFNSEPLFFWTNLNKIKKDKFKWN